MLDLEFMLLYISIYYGYSPRYQMHLTISCKLNSLDAFNTYLSNHVSDLQSDVRNLINHHQECTDIL